MTDHFNPYHQWLRIPPSEHPPSHYRLLGITPFEDNAEVIETAAKRQVAHVRQYESGPHAELSRKLATRITKARDILLNPAKKKIYDAALREAIEAKATETKAAEAKPRKHPPNIPGSSSSQVTQVERSQPSRRDQHSTQEAKPSQEAARSWKMPPMLILKLVIVGISGLVLLILYIRSHTTDSSEGPSTPAHVSELLVPAPPRPSPSPPQSTPSSENDDALKSTPPDTPIAPIVPGDEETDYPIVDPTALFLNEPKPIRVAEDIHMVIDGMNVNKTQMTSSPSSRYLLIEELCETLNAIVVDLQDGKLCGRIRDEKCPKKSFVSPDGKHCVSLYRDRDVLLEVWLVSTGKLVGTILRSESSLQWVQGVAVSARGELVLSGGVYSKNSRRPYWMKRPKDLPSKICFAEVWKLPECRRVAELYREPDPETTRSSKRYVYRSSFSEYDRLLPMSPDGDHVYFEMHPNELFLYKLPESRLVGSLVDFSNQGSPINDASAFSPNGRYLASVDGDYFKHSGSLAHLIIMDLTKKNPTKIDLMHCNLTKRNSLEQFSSLSPIEWFPDNRHFVVNRECLIDAEQGKLVGAIASSAYGARRFTGSHRAVGLWKGMFHGDLPKIQLTNYRYVPRARPIPQEGSSMLWHPSDCDVEPDPAPAPLVGHWSYPLGDSPPKTIRFLGPICLIQLDTRKLHHKKDNYLFIDWRTGQVKGTTGLNIYRIDSIDDLVNPEGTHWANNSWDSDSIVVQSIETGQSVFVYPCVKKAMFLPNHRILIVPGTRLGVTPKLGPITMEIWDFQRKHLEQVICIPMPWTELFLKDNRSMAVSPGGRYLAITFAEDRRSRFIEIFDLKTMKCVGKKSLESGYQSGLQYLDFAPNGRELLLISGSRNGTTTCRWAFTEKRESEVTFPMQQDAWEKNELLKEASFWLVRWTVDQKYWASGNRILVDPQTASVTSIVQERSPFPRKFLSQRRAIVVRPPSPDQKEWVLETKEFADEELAQIDFSEGEYHVKTTNPPNPPIPPKTSLAKPTPPPETRVVSEPDKTPKPTRDDLVKTPSVETPILPPIPTAVEQKKSLDMLHEVLEKEYANGKTASGKRALIDALFKLANQLSDDPPSLYVTLHDAAKTTALIGDIDKTFIALDQLSKKFDSQPWDLWPIVAKSLSRSLRLKKDQVRLANRLLEIIDKAILASQFDVADQLIEVNLLFATRFRSESLSKKCSQASETCSKTRFLVKDYPIQMEKLKANSKDSMANETIGLWRCCIENQWDEGLKNLVYAKNPNLRLIATAERSKPSTIESQLDLANMWWDLASNTSPLLRRGMFRRAAHWYVSVLDKNRRKDDALQRTVQERLNQIYKQFPSN